MEFDWDDEKELENIRKHGYSFEEVIPLFKKHNIVFEDDRFDYGEERFLAIGLLRYNVIVVVHVYREQNIIRIISARKATKYEEKLYFTS